MSISATAQDGPLRPVALGQQPTRRPGILTVLRWEVAKLSAQLRSRLLLLFCLIGPPIIVIVLAGQQPPPKDTIYVRERQLLPGSSAT